MRWLWASLVFVPLLSLAGWGGYRLWPRELALTPAAHVPEWGLDGGQAVVRSPGQSLVAEVGWYDDELLAYLMFDYLRSGGALAGAEVLLSYRDGDRRIYPILVHLPNDLLAAGARLARLQAEGVIPEFEWRLIAAEALAGLRRRTDVFVAAYNLPVQRKLESLSRAELTAYMRRFVRFKSMTDRRVQRGLEAAPSVLSPTDAHYLAADIIAVADFFLLPIEFFLGIGAMENNYMNAKGDLERAVWKRRSQKGDVVLKRRRGRVLVLNEASGVWQITRETLRYAHRLYLKDSSDYSLLPEHLRPPKELDLDEVPPEVLTTYAGLLFRDLLDRFQGDVAKAVGAYNGGPGNPNMRYEEGVRLVADYARKVLEHAAALSGRSVAEMSFIGPAGT